MGCALLCALLLLLPKGTEKSLSVLREAAGNLNQYRITLKLDDQHHTLSITEEIQFTNRTVDTLSQMVLRLWVNQMASRDTSPAALEELFDACYPNGFSPGYVTLHDVKWNGERADHYYADAEKTILNISIPEMAPGEEGTLYLRCVIALPNCAYRTGYVDSTYLLNHVIPTLSVYEEGGWRQDAYTPIGDPFYTECANYDVTLHLPEGFVPACSVPLEKGKEGAYTGSGLALRDIGLWAARGMAEKQAIVNGTCILAYGPDDASANKALGDAGKALKTFEALYGAYPYESYTVCAAPFAPGAMEYPCMAIIDESYFEKSQWDTLELFIAHETAHQWFYHLVGSDPVNQPWQDEALCEYALLRYVEQQYGQSAFDTLRYYRVDSPMQERIPGNLTPGSPITYFSNLSDYKAIVYGRGAGLMLALNTFLQGGMDGFLKQYVQDYAFHIASRQDFEQALNAYTNQDLLPLLQDYLDTRMME